MGRVKRKLWTGLLLFALLWTAGAPGEDAAPKETAAPLVPALELPAPENGSLVEIPVDQMFRLRHIVQQLHASAGQITVSALKTIDYVFPEPVLNLGKIIFILCHGTMNGIGQISHFLRVI